MSRCDQYLTLLSARLDGPLSPEEEARLRGHLSTCPQCRQAAQELETIHRALRALPRLDPPAGLKDAVMDAIAAETVIPLPVKRPAPWKKWLATAAVLAVILGGAGTLRLWQSGGTGKDAAAEVPNAVSAQGSDQDAERSASAVQSAAPEAALQDQAAPVEIETAQETAPANEVLHSAAPAAPKQPETAAYSQTGGAGAPTPSPRTAKRAEVAGSTSGTLPTTGGTSDALTADTAPEVQPFSSTTTEDGGGADARTSDAPQSLLLATGAPTRTGSFSPAQALALVVAHVNAAAEAPLSNVYDEAALACTNSLAEGDALVNTVTYEGLSADQDHYLFGVDAPADQDRYSHFLVALDTGEVSQIYTLEDTVKNSDGPTQWETTEDPAQPPVPSPAPSQAPADTPAEADAPAEVPAGDPTPLP